jgi:hypothetical protein
MPTTLKDLKAELKKSKEILNTTLTPWEARRVRDRARYIADDIFRIETEIKLAGC